MSRLAQDTPQELLTLLETSWLSANTNNKTPQFLKVTDYKSYDFRGGKDVSVVFTQVPLIRQGSMGIGATRKWKKCIIKLDVRVLGLDQEAHYLNVIAEIVRILDLNMIDAITDWQELRIDDTDFLDMSDKSKGMFRKIIQVTLINWNVARGA